MVAVHALFAMAAWIGSTQQSRPGGEERGPGLAGQAGFAAFYPTFILAFPLLVLREAVLDRYPSLDLGTVVGALLWLFAACWGGTVLYLSRQRPAAAPTCPSES